MNFNSLKLSKMLLFTLLIVTSNSYVQAADDSTQIRLSYKHIEYLNFTGTAVGAAKDFNANELLPTNATGQATFGSNQSINLGTLGLNSNIPGDCTLDFSTTNNFRLVHQTLGQTLTSYQLNYKNTNISQGNSNQIVLPCTSPLSNIDFKATGAITEAPSKGVYQDIVRITVTSE